MPANSMSQEVERSIERDAQAEREQRMEAARQRVLERQQQESQPAPAEAQNGAPDAPERPQATLFGQPIPPGNPLYAMTRLGLNPDAAAIDIGQGLVESPAAVTHGVIDAANSTMGLIDELGNSLGRLTNFDPRVTLLDPETGEFRVGFTMDPDAFREALAANGVMSAEEAANLSSMPQIGQPLDNPTSNTGQLIEGMTQFLAGFAGGGAALKGAGWLRHTDDALTLGQQGMNLTRAFVQGAISDFAAFDGQEERLSNLIESMPELQNPVTEFLAADDDDGEVEGRLKNVLEGGALGVLTNLAVLTDLAVPALRAMRNVRRTREALGEAEALMSQADADAANVITRDIISLGDPAGPPVSIVEPAGRMEQRMLGQGIDDIREGRRGLDRLESEHLLGAAERWAEAVSRVQPERTAELNDLIAASRERVNNGDYEHLLDAMDEARKPSSNAVSLFDFIRQEGGIRLDDGGELAGLDLRPMRMRKGQPVGTNRGEEVINPNGRTLDEILERASEAGYIGQRNIEGGAAGFSAGDVSELIDAIRMEAGGERVFSLNDADDIFAEAARRDMLDTVDRLGLDANAPIAARRSEAERLASWQEGQPLTLRDVDARDADMEAAGGAIGVRAPTGDLLGGQEVRINFNALNSEDSIRSIIGQVADAFSTEINAARGRRGDVQVIKDAQQRNAWDDLNARRAGEPLSDSQVLAAQSVYQASAENLKSALATAAREGSDMAHFNARRALSVHRAIQAEIAGAKADAGRALRAWSIPIGADATARRQMDEILQSHGGRISNENLARMQQMAETDPKALDRAARYTSIREAAADVGADAIRFAFLSGPQTHIMNMAGNTLTTVYDTLPRLMAGMKGRILGDPELERQLGAALAEYAGLAAGIRAQFSAFAKSGDYANMGRNLREIWDSAGQSQGRSYRQALMDTAALPFQGRFDDRGVSGRKFAGNEYNRAVSAERFGLSADSAWGTIVNGTGRVLSAPTDFLGFSDDFFKGVNELSTRHRMAYEIAVEELGTNADRAVMQRRMADLIENPTREMLDEARATAQRRTFTDPVGPNTKAILQIRNGLNGTGFPLGHLLLPFIVTPSNILKYAFTNSPVGGLFRSMQEDIQAGGPRAEVAKARVAAGTGLLFIGMDMAWNGQITGRAPSDPGEREALSRTGWQEYSIRIDGKYYSYRRLEPVSTMIAIGSDLQQMFARAQFDGEVGVEMERAAMAAFGAAVSVVTDKTYLTGISEFFSFADDSDRYGPSFLTNMIGALAVPTGISQIERAIDPEIRDAQGILDRVMSRIPGMSDELPQQHDLWGRPRIYESGNGRMYDALAPWQARTIDASPIDAELIRLGDFPRMPDRSITVRTSAGLPQSVSLRNAPDIYQRYVRLAGNDAPGPDGRGAFDMLNAVVSGEHPLSAQYQQLSDNLAEPRNKGDFIRRVIDQYREAARDTLMVEYREELRTMADDAFEAQQAASRARTARAAEAVAEIVQ